MVAVIDSDQHLYESRTLWAEHIDPSQRARGARHRRRRARLPVAHLAGPAAVDSPTSSFRVEHGRARPDRASACRQHMPPEYRLRRRPCPPSTGTRPPVSERLGHHGSRRSGGVPELRPAVGAPACRSPAGPHREHGRLEPLVRLGRAADGRAAPSGGPPDAPRSGVAGAAAGRAVGGRRAPGHDRAGGRGRAPAVAPDHERLWAAFVHHGSRPCSTSPTNPGSSTRPSITDPDESFVPVLESVFLWVPPAIAVTDLIVNGVLERHPELRIGIVELSSIWVPQYLLMLDGGWEFTSTLNGRPLAPLTCVRASTSAARCRCRRSPTSSPAGSPPSPATSSCAAATSPTRRGRPRRSRTTPGTARRRGRPASSTTTSWRCSGPDDRPEPSGPGTYQGFLIRIAHRPGAQATTPSTLSSTMDSVS